MGRAYEVRKASIAKSGAAKTKIYIMYSKEIYSAAKKGGTDPNTNQTLKRLIERSKRDQVPSDLIKRALDKVSSGVDESYSSLRYEGFGPGSSTIIVDCLTDNINRTISAVRNAFTKTDGKLGSLNSVSYMYEHLCVISFKGLTEEETLNALINENIDVNDIEVEDGIITVYGNPQDLYKIKNAITTTKPDITFELDEITMLPRERVTLEGEDLLTFKRLLQMLDDIDDVQEVYHNVSID